MNNIFDKLLDIIYPKVCGICGKIDKNDICIKCKNKLNKYKESKKHIYLSKNYNTHLYVFRYQEIVKQAIINYKFSDKPYIYKSFVNFLLNDKKVCGLIKKYDIIMPVPISKNRQKKRGYNQSFLIIKDILKQIESSEIITDVLYKKIDTKTQSSLNKIDRQSNLNGAYIVKNEYKIKNKKVLLFDDVYTTGSTIEECSKVLKSAGAYEVGAITLAKD